MSDAATNWNVSDYNIALKNATDWAKAMEKLRSNEKEVLGSGWSGNNGKDGSGGYGTGTKSSKFSLKVHRQFRI